MTFAQAIEQMTQGKKMIRPGLSGQNHVDHITENSSLAPEYGFVVTCDGRVNPWRPSKMDLADKEWEEV